MSVLSKSFLRYRVRGGAEARTCARARARRTTQAPSRDSMGRRTHSRDRRAAAIRGGFVGSVRGGYRSGFGDDRVRPRRARSRAGACGRGRRGGIGRHRRFASTTDPRRSGNLPCAGEQAAPRRPRSPPPRSDRGGDGPQGSHVPGGGCSRRLGRSPLGTGHTHSQSREFLEDRRATEARVAGATFAPGADEGTRRGAARSSLPRIFDHHRHRGSRARSGGGSRRRGRATKPRPHGP